MFDNAVLLYVFISDSLLDVLPESLDLFILGSGLISITIGLRWLMEKRKQKDRRIKEEALHISI